MPGEADRLKKEVDALRKEIRWHIARYVELNESWLAERAEKTALNDQLMDVRSMAGGEMKRMHELVDALTVEKEELREEARKLSADNASLEGSLELANEKLGKALAPKEKVTVVGPFWEEGVRPLSIPERQEKLELRVHELEGRVDQLAAAHDAWDLIRDNISARLTGVEVAQRDLFSRMARLERTEEPLPEHRWWWK